MEKDKPKNNRIKEFFRLQEVFGYFFRRKSTVDNPDFSLRSMHFVNKFSMVVFLLAIIYLLIKHLL